MSLVFAHSFGESWRGRVSSAEGESTCAFSKRCRMNIPAELPIADCCRLLIAKSEVFPTL
jgi:hypothetical protein